MARRTLSDKGVAALKPRAERFAYPDPELAGHYVRVQPKSGAKAYVAVARTPTGKQVWSSIGACDVMKIDEARELARDVIKRVRAGLPAVDAKPDSVKAVVDNWIKLYLEHKKKQHLPINDPARYRLRSQREIRRMLNSHILPAWRDREFISIKRSDITKLMDKVADRHGDRAADYVLTTFSSIANWYARRVDDYNSPIPRRGMRRQSVKAQARARILTDDEIKTVWAAAADAGKFGAIVKLLLLTGQRMSRVAEMKWSEVDGDGLWTLPLAPREKENGGKLQLPPAALEVIRAQARVDGNDHVFPGRMRGDYRGPFKGLGQTKAVMDRKTGMSGWVVHDLRRTARSLMSRAGVRPDISERTLGHAIVGVAGTYDRFEYRGEKADALARLAALIDDIVHPRPANVVPMAAKRSRK
jgi:integrase